MFHSTAVNAHTLLAKLAPLLLRLGVPTGGPFSSSATCEMHGGAWLSHLTVFRLRCSFLLLFVFTICYEVRVSRTFTLHEPMGWLKYYTNWAWLCFGGCSALGAALSHKEMTAMLVLGPDRATTKDGSDADGEYVDGAGSCDRDIEKADRESSDLPVTISASSSSRCRDQARKHSFRTGPISLWPNYIHLHLFVTTLCSQFIVFVFYWGLSSNINYNLDNVIRHGAGMVLLSIELIGTRISVSSSSLPFVMGLPSIYLLFMSVRGRLTGDWVYRELDPDSNPLSPLYYLALVILVIGSFGVAYLMAIVRDRVLQLNDADDDTH